MSFRSGRWAAAHEPAVAEGWTLERRTRPALLYGANGIRTGADGRIYIAQVAGSQISALDVDSAEIETICPMGGPIVAPDDLAFDDAGNIFATEITEGRVSMLSPDGTARVLHGAMPVANPITVHRNRIFAGECRMGGRIMELDRDGGAPRILLEDVPMANAFEVGPDGKLYFPVMGANEIWRVDLDGGVPERVTGDLGVPDAAKFHPDGYIVSTQVASGQVLKIDPRTGDKSVLAEIAPGLDNVTFVGRRTFVSSIPGMIHEILADGSCRSVVPMGLSRVLGLAIDATGSLFASAGPFLYRIEPDGELKVEGMIFSPGSPGDIRGLRCSAPGEFIVTNSMGVIAAYRPRDNEGRTLAEGLKGLSGLTLAADGSILFAEEGTGRLCALRSGHVEELARGLTRPTGVAIVGESCLVTEAGAGRVVQVTGGHAETLVDGLVEPQGIHVMGRRVFIVDAGARAVIEHNLDDASTRTIAHHLPVGPPPGIVPRPLGPVGDLAGPITPFADIIEGPGGSLLFSADGEGSVMQLRPAV